MIRKQQIHALMVLLSSCQYTTVRLFIAIVVMMGALILPLMAYQMPRTAIYTTTTYPVMLPATGLHAAEQLPGAQQPVPFRWTHPTATVHVANPGGSALVRLTVGGGTARTIPITIAQGDIALPMSQPMTMVITPEPRIYAVLLPPAQHERFALTIVAPSWHHKQRDLGVMLGTIRVAGTAHTGMMGVPATILAALVIGSLSLVALLCHHLTPLRSITVVCALQLGVSVWLAVGGWHYALFVPLMALVTATALLTIALHHWLPHHIPTSHCDACNNSAAAYSSWLIVLLLGALALRLVWLTAADPVGDLELAARRMWHLHHLGLHGAYIYDGDYMPLRLLLLSALSTLVKPLGGDFHAPLPGITKLLIKLPGVLADLTTIWLIYRTRYRVTHATAHTARGAFMLAALYAATPPVWMNVAWWGQVDALLLLPLVALVLLLERAEGRWSWLLWACALLIKPQAIVLAPLLYAATMRLHGSRGVLIGVAIATTTFLAGITPFVVAGQGNGMLQAYSGSVGRFPKITIGAYNLWYLLLWGQSANDDTLLWGSISYRMVGLMSVALVALFVMLVILLERRSSPRTHMQGATLLMLAFFVLPTQIHERYLFLSLVFLVLCSAYDVDNNRYIIGYLIIATNATLNILGTLKGFVPVAYETIRTTPLPFVCAVLNGMVLCGVVWHMGSILVKQRE